MSRLRVPAGGWAAFAAGLCQDARIDLRLGRRWRFDALNRLIEVDAAAVAAESPAAGGLLVHEIGHVCISRYHEFAPTELAPTVWSQFMNMLEDPRVNGWMQRRYPGTVPWFEAMFESDRATPVSSACRFLLWGAAVSVADAYDWQGAPDWIEDQPDVLAAYRETVAARRRYAEALPPADLWVSEPTAKADCGPAESLPAGMAERLRPLRPERPPDAVEWRVLRAAARAILVAEGEVLPSVRPLIEADVGAISGFLAAEPLLAEDLEDALRRDSSLATEIIEHGLAKPPKTPPGEPDALARRALVWFLERRLAGDADAPAGLAEVLLEGHALGRRKRSRGKGVRRDEMIGAALRQMPRLQRDLEAVLSARSPRRLRSGYAQGARVDLDRARTFAATRRGYDKMWQRRSRLASPQAAVSLLVDLSGSMEGEKIAAAIAGTRLLAETLDRFFPAVRTAINGFQDELIPFLGFGERLSAARRADILEMAGEAGGTRPGGHNCPRWNDDAPCLEEAARALAREDGERLLIVVSDGRPAGRRSTEQDLHDVVTRLSASAGLTLFGLGLGPKTGHVRDYYPHAVADIPVERFAEEVGALLRRVLLRSPGGCRACGAGMN